MSVRAPNAGRFSRHNVTALHNAGAVAASAFFTTVRSKAVPATAFALTPLVPSTFPPLVPAATLELTPVNAGINLAFVPSAALDLTALPSSLQSPAAIPAATLTLAAQPPSYGIGKQLSSAVTLSLTALAPQLLYTPPVVGQSPAIYRAYLYADGYDRLELPLSSFQSTRRNGEATYLSIVVPAPVAYLDGIEDRLDGEIVLYSGFVIGGVETLTELIRANLSSFRYDLGANSGSATLTGYKQVTYTNPKTRALQGISFKSAIDDVRRVRCEPDMWLSPGDTADLGGGEMMVVGRIAYTINPKSATMEVIEVET